MSLCQINEHATAEMEFEHISAWAYSCNLSLKSNKSGEIMFMLGLYRIFTSYSLQGWIVGQIGIWYSAI